MATGHGHGGTSRASERSRTGVQRSGSRPARNTARPPGNRKKREPVWRRLFRRSTLAGLGQAARNRALPVAIVLGSTAALGAAGVGGYRWLTQGETFRISGVDLSGQEHLSADEVTRLLDLAPEANIFRTSMAKLENRLEQSPWVKSASVSRELPNELRIRLVEQEAVAAVSLDGMYLLNREGEPFKRADALEGELDELVVITGIERDDFLAAPGDWQEELSKTIRAAEEYASVSERPALGEIHLDALRGPTFITYEQAVAIHVGLAELEDLPERFQAFDAAWEALSDEQRQAARSLRIRNASPSDRVTVAFAGK